MAWEILHDTDLNKAIIFCNTTDLASNPVVPVENDFNKELFYQWWESMGFFDPRKLDRDEIYDNWKKFDLFCSEPEVKVCFNYKNKPSRVFNINIDGDGSLFFPFVEGLEDGEYDLLEEIQTHINESLWRGVWCGKLPYQYDSKWCLTAVKQGYNCDFVPLESAKSFPNSLPNNDDIVQEAIEILNH